MSSSDRSTIPKNAGLNRNIKDKQLVTYVLKTIFYMFNTHYRKISLIGIWFKHCFIKKENQ